MLTRPSAHRPQPAAGEGVALMPLLTRLHQQERLSGALGVLALATGALGEPAQVVALMRDAATDSWRLTSLLDPNGRPLAFERLGLPAEPFEFAPPTLVTSAPLEQILGLAWGEERCWAVSEALRARTVTSALIGEAEQPRGALLLFSGSAEPAPAIVSLVTHAALAAGRLTHAADQQAHDGVLTYAQWEERAGDEIERAARYHRPLALLAIEFERALDLATTGAQLARSCRRFDVIGRLGTARPTLVVLLPEAGASEANRVADRLSALTAGRPIGAAALPDDGILLDRLLAVALDRLASVTPPAPAEPAAPTWTRRRLIEPDADTVRCPVCLAAYSRPHTSADAETASRQRRQAAEALRVACPRHSSSLPLAA